MTVVTMVGGTLLGRPAVSWRGEAALIGGLAAFPVYLQHWVPSALLSTISLLATGI